MNQPASSGSSGAAVGSFPLPRLPSAGRVWSRTVDVLSVLTLLFTLDQLTILLGDFWLLESVHLASVFWTNFEMGAWLYVLTLAMYAGAVVVPAFVHDLGSAGRAWLIKPGVLFATVVAYWASLEYQHFLFGVQEISFNEADPVFGKDLGFYVFELPYMWTIWWYVSGAFLVFLLASVAAAHVSTRGKSHPDAGNTAINLLGRLATGPARLGVLLTGLMLAIALFLGRYGLLTADNVASSVHVGAEYIDVTGLFSTLNYLNLTALLALAVTVVLVSLLRHWNGLATGRAPKQAPWLARHAAYLLLGIVGFDFMFRGLIEVRDQFAVQPNEPVIQLEYIKRHVAATRRAAGLENVERIEYRPNGPGAPLPDPEVLINSAALRNAPLWPGFVSQLERLLDPQHAQRILQTGGDSVIYGPTMDQFQQEQKLRTYYRFEGVDNVRYTIDGEQRLLVSGVRELPMHAAEPWLSYFGQRFVLYTHGFGLAAAPAYEVTEEGGVNFISREIPAVTTAAPLKVDNERVYYGEGAATMSFSNVDQMKELDFPSAQGRSEIWLPEGETTSVPLDSIWKRLGIGWRSGHPIELVFSDLIKDTTRVHFYREPLRRLERIAPFLYFDTNPYAVAADGRIVWMVNAMTTSNDYPYALHGELGDKADQRSKYSHPTRFVNYIEDSVKATVDAYTGQVTFYQMNNSPVVATWAAAYPGLFTPISQMPVALRDQITYPLQFFHFQFDDVYILYHMEDPMYFFNLEDMWDDVDEVLGPVLADGKAITFSVEPYQLILNTGGFLPKSERKTQYTMLAAFTPEVARNLRAIPLVYQDWPDYGKLAVLEIPKGMYVMGTEQADSAIDQDPEISQQFALWTRRGMEVIRGHTITIPFENEVMYVEPIFLRSSQNPVSQLKRVVVVFREQVAMAPTLQAALNDVLNKIGGDAKTLAQAPGRPK